MPLRTPCGLAPAVLLRAAHHATCRAIGASAAPAAAAAAGAARRGLSSASAPAPATAAAAAAAAAANEAAALNERLLTTPSNGVSFVGPLAVAHIKGKGRALISTAHVAIGGLLLLAQPLAFCAGKHGSDDLPDTAGLVAQLQAGVPPALRPWLHVLTRGPSAVAVPAPSGLDSPAGLTQLLHQGGSGAVLGSAGQLTELVAFNAFGDKFDDAVAAETLREAARGGSVEQREADSRELPHVGVWPVFPFFNHSCLPNAVHYVIGRMLVVRAAAPLVPGEEVAISYLGTEDHSPAAMRRHVLNERYGFMCSCARCQLEDQLPSRLSALLLAIHTQVKEKLMPALEAAVEDDLVDEAVLEQIRLDVVALSTELFTHLGTFVESAAARNFAPTRHVPLAEGLDAPESGGPEHAALCIEASIYEFFQLMAMRDEVAGDDHTASLQMCTQILDAVSRGSELHTFLTARVLSRELAARRKRAAGGGDDGDDESGSADSVKSAAQDCKLAHTARYGPLPRQRLLQTFDLSERIGRNFL